MLPIVDRAGPLRAAGASEPGEEELTLPTEADLVTVVDRRRRSWRVAGSRQGVQEPLVCGRAVLVCEIGQAMQPRRATAPRARAATVSPCVAAEQG